KLAARNLKVAAPARGKYDYSHVEEGFDADANQVLRRLQRKDGRGPVVISGDNSFALKRAVQEIAEGRALVGRPVVLVTCGEGNSAMPDSLLREAGAAQVFHLAQPVNQKGVLPFVTALLRHLAVSEPGRRRIADAIKRAIEDVRRGGHAAPADVQMFEEWIHQIGRGPDDPGRHRES